MSLQKILSSLALCLALLHTPAFAGGGPFGIDSLVSYDDGGLYAYQKEILRGAQLLTVGGAFWLGSESRAGKTFWAGLDGMVMGAGLVTQVIKRTFSRARPRDGGDPDLFFQGWSNESFISGDVAVMASLVTPWMLEYGKDAPAVYLLSALPLYTSMARLKVHAHWQSDVIGGLLIGGLAGYWAHQRDTPFLLFFTSDGVFVGLKKKF